MWSKEINIKNVIEIRTKTTCYFGAGALAKIEDILDFLKERGIKSVVVVSDKVAYKVTGAWDKVKPALEKRGIEYVVYDDVTPNPTTEQINEATKKALEINAQAVIGIGGGSPIDTAKSVAILLEYPEKTAEELYEQKFIPEKAKPIIAINTTHGTGTEVDRFAVASILEKEYKPPIAYDCIYPTFSIDDPELTKSLPEKQSIYTSLDALNHITEAATTSLGNPFSINLARNTVELISEYLPEVLKKPDNLEARYFLMYASAIAGISFDNGMLHLTHALEHPLSAIKPDLPHGLGLAMLLPAVFKYTYKAKPQILAYVYQPIIPDLKGRPNEAEEAASKLEQWIFNLGVKEKLADVGFSEKDIPKLVKLAFETPALDLLLNLAPMKVDENLVEAIYKESLKPY